MEEQLSLLDLVWNASFTVQFVMAILLMASMMSWYMIVNRYIYFRNANDEMYRFEERFWSGVDLSQLYREGNERSAEGQAVLGMESIFRAGFKEFSRLAQQSEVDSEAVIEGSRRAMRVAMMREEERLERHLAFLRRSVPPVLILACLAQCGASCILFAGWPILRRPRWPP